MRKESSVALGTKGKIVFDSASNGTCRDINRRVFGYNRFNVAIDARYRELPPEVLPATIVWSNVRGAA